MLEPKNSFRWGKGLGLAATVICLCRLTGALAQGTAFTYQGRLNDTGQPANGTYDLRFTIYDSTNLPGNIVAGPLTNSSTGVSNGLFAVTLDFGSGVFTGPARFLQIETRTNGAAAFTSLNPRQDLTPSPYAIFAASASNVTGTLPSGGLAGTYSGAVILNNSSNEFTGSGAGLTNVNATTLGGLSAGGFWQSSGNSGTTAGANFLGTKDNQSLELHVNGQRALRLEPTIDGANFIGGGFQSTIQPNNSDCTISGGQNCTIQPNALKATISGGFGHTIETGSYEATIGGGFGNTIGTNSPDATIAGGFEGFIETNAPNAVIGGGYQNIIAGYLPAPGVPYAATIAGGRNNIINGNSASSAISGGSSNIIQLGALYASIGGGFSNVAAQVGVTIAGGGYDGVNPVYGNVVSANGSAIGGGVGNSIQSAAGDSAIAGGYANTIQGSAPYATIAGGRQNQISTGGWGAVIGGGQGNTIASATGSGGTLGDASFTTLSGGFRNYIGTNANYSVIAGGALNIIGAFDTYAVIGGGNANFILTNATEAFIGGGGLNTIDYGSSYSTIAGGQNSYIEPLASSATIGGGDSNLIETNADHSVIAGGYQNTIGTFCHYGTISGGSLNSISIDLANTGSTICGGYSNSVSGAWATVCGGYANVASGNDSFAAGTGAQALDAGSFVWNDGSVPTTSSTGSGQFVARASGGFTFYSSTGTVGVQLPSGSGSWSPLSDRNSKENFQPVNSEAVLERVAHMPVTTWNYKTQDKSIRHLGPMAQDFYAAFGVGEDDRHIATVDESGVALAAIQGLNQKLEAEAKAKDAEIADLKGRVSELEAIVKKLATGNVLAKVEY